MPLALSAMFSGGSRYCEPAGVAFLALFGEGLAELLLRISSFRGRECGLRSESVFICHTGGGDLFVLAV
jgi:hypothetical protein